MNQFELLCHISLVYSEDKTNSNYVTFPKRVDVNLTGELCIPPTIINDPLDGKDKMFFIVNDIGILHPGYYSLLFKVIEMERPTIKEIITNEFRIYSKRDFRKPRNFSVLQEHAAKQGCYDKN
ncbi:hypothetical protein HDV01_003691, partial [Terramyces sp. JEL0728]